MQNILADMAVSVTELKKNPSAVMSGAKGAPVAVLNHNRVMGYMVPADVFEAMVERLDDLELTRIAKERIEANEPTVRAKIVGDDIVFEGDDAV